MGLKIKIKNSVIILADQREGGLLEQIRRFNLSDKTPIDCMDFIRRLKERYGKEEV